MKILVTGSSGFIGTHLLKYYTQQKSCSSVIGLSRSRPLRIYSPQTIVCTYGDDLKPLLAEQKPDAIIHAAGAANPSYSFKNPQADFAANTGLIQQIFHTLHELNLKTPVINLSSAAIYGDPIELPLKVSSEKKPVSPYGIHKLLSEQVCEHLGRLYSIQTANLRIFSAYGPYLQKQVIWSILKKIMTQNSVTLFGTGNESRDFIYVEDVCRFIDSILQSASLQGESYNIASGRGVNIRKIALTIAKLTNYQGDINFTGEQEAGKPIHWLADTACVQPFQNFELTPIDKGLKKTVEWSKNLLTS